MAKDERSVYFYDVQAESWHRRFKGLAPFPHFDLLSALNELYEQDRAEIINSRKEAVYIADMRMERGVCEMVVNFSDTQAADPAFSDRGRRRRRVVPKEGDEGLEHSAHIIWVYGTRQNDAPAIFLLEAAPGLSSMKITKFFNSLLRAYAQVSGRFEMDDPEGAMEGGKFKQIKVRPRIELVGHPSAEFIRDLRAGSLLEVELFTRRDAGVNWDGQGRVIEDKSSVTLRPNPTKALPRAKTLLDGIRGKDRYEFARIRFKTESDVTRSVSVQSADYHLLNNDRYVRKERIHLPGANLPTSFAEIHGPIIQAMRQFI